MAGRIPRHFIDDLLARTDIVELIDGYVPLKKAGRNYQACCPFHNEKSPSFSVSPDKQFYYCFGCGATGNAISFLMEYDKLEFVEAIEDLAQMYNLEVPREDSPGFGNKKPQFSRAEIASDHDLMEQVSRYFRHNLKHHKNGPKVIEYIKSRGLSGAVVQQFGIGYAPEEWDGALKTFGSNDVLRQQLLDLKVTTSNDNGRVYDFFRDRLMFPIRNKRGKVIGFGGRVLGDGTPKYLNSPETRIFHKGLELYGLFEAKQFNEKLDHVIVVEGYMDVVALAQAGIRNAVASLGTSTTPEHLQMLFRMVKKVVFCYDGDRAGFDAAWRALENGLAHLKDGIELTFTFLPEGEDPDTLVQKEGKDAFLQRLDNAKPFSQFFFEHLLGNIDITNDAGKTELVAQAKPLIEKIPSDFFRDLVLDKLASIVGRERGQLERYFTKPQQHRPQQKALKITPMRRAIGLLVQQPKLAKAIPLNNAYENIDMPGFDLFYGLQRTILTMENPTTAQLVELYRDEAVGPYISRLAAWDHQIESDELMEAEFKATVRFIEDEYLKQRAEQLLLKEKTEGMSAKERREYQLLLIALNNHKKPNA